MKMHETITPQEKKDNLVDHLLIREDEVHNYQVNIDNYTAILTVLPSVWPPELIQYKGYSPKDVVEKIPEAEQDSVSDLIYMDRITFLLRTEKIEQRKARLVYDAMSSQIDAGELPGLLDSGRASKRANPPQS